MKKTLSIVLALMLVLACFAACGKTDKPDADVDNSLQNVLDAGKLVIATSPDFPPFENLNDDGSVTGIEIDILSRICTKLGVDLQIDQYDFDAILTGLDAGKYDLAVKTRCSPIRTACPRSLWSFPKAARSRPRLMSKTRRSPARPARPLNCIARKTT